jgi:hypothetical protein
MLWPSVRCPRWLRMNSQTLPSAGPHAEPRPARPRAAPRGQLAGVNSVSADRDGHSSIVNQNRDRVPVTRTSPTSIRSPCSPSPRAAPSEPSERSIQEYRRLQELDRVRLPSRVNTAVDVQHTFRPPSQRPLGMLQSLERAEHLPALGLAVLAIDLAPDGYRQIDRLVLWRSSAPAPFG